VPGTVDAKVSLGCQNATLARFDGTTSPPRISIPIPSRAALGGAESIVLYGQICAGLDSAPTFDPQSGVPNCKDRQGATVSFDFPLQLGADANYNPHAAFVESTDESAATTVDVTWVAPTAAEVPAGGLRVTFTFVTRDNRGGTDWTTRTLCVSP
jgi:hypothetical protein